MAEQSLNQQQSRKSPVQENSAIGALARSILSGVIEPVKNSIAQVKVLNEIANKLDINRTLYKCYSDYIAQLPLKIFSGFSLDTPVAKHIQTKARDNLIEAGLLDKDQSV